MTSAGPENLTESFRGKMAGGDKTRKALSQILGLSLTKKDFSLESAVFTETGIRLHLRYGRRKKILFSIEKRDEKSKGIVITDSLVISYRGVDLPLSLSSILTTVAADNLEKHSMESLKAIFTEDPKCDTENIPLSESIFSNRPDSLLDSWGSVSAWADFFAVDELARGNLDSLENLFVFVQHGDIECEHLFPHGPAPANSIVRYPWDNRIRTNAAPVPKGNSGTMLTSEITENDVISGNPEKLRCLLRYAAAEANKRGSTLFVSNTCVPVMTGEDVKSEFLHCTVNCNRTPLYLTIGPESMSGVFEDLLVRRRLHAEHSAGLPDASFKNKVNLVGFAETPDLEELRSMLKMAGISVNRIIIPGISEETVEKLPEASLGIIRPARSWEHLYSLLEKDSRIKNIRPPAPFGISKTRIWLEEIIKSLDSGEPKIVWNNYFKDFEDRWKKVQEEASLLRLGIIVRASEIHNLQEPACTWGIPLITMLEEAGFGLDLLLMFEEASQVRAAKDIHALFKNPDRHTIKGFDTFSRMLSQIRKMPCDAIFSNHTYDWRITSSGKNIFSLQHFEMGVAGAIRTTERLIGISRNPFYRRFQPYLENHPRNRGIIRTDKK